MSKCIPIRDLKDTTGISQLCHTSAEPIIVTKNGYEDMVIMSVEVYERIRLYSIYEKLMEAEKDINEGKLLEMKDALSDIKEKYGL